MIERGFRRVGARYIIYAVAASFSLSFCVWATRHHGLLEPFILHNQISPAGRGVLLRYLGIGMSLTLCAWVALSQVLAKAGGVVLERALSRTAAWLSLLCPSGLLPGLLIADLGADYRFLTFFLVMSTGALFYFAVREVQETHEVNLRHGDADATRKAWWVGLVSATLLSIGYGVYFSVFTLADHNAFRTHAYDLGIFDQVMYHAVHQGKMLFTVVHNPPESFWGVHFSPALYLLAPLYALYEDARTLLVAQSFLLGAGAVTLYAFAARKVHPLSASVLSVSYLLYAALHGVNTFGFHAVALAPLLLLLTLFYLERDNLALFWLFLALSLLIKEDLALTGAAIGLYLLAKGRFALGLGVTGVCALTFFAVIKMIIPHFSEGDYSLIEGRFGDVIAPSSQGLVGVVETGLSNPLYLLTYIVSNPNKLAYLCQLFVPVMFLPLLAGRAWLIIVPALATALLSSFGGQFNIGNQYPAVIIPLVYVLAVLGLSRLPRVHHIGVVVALLASSLLMNYQYGKVPPAALFTSERRSVVHEPTPERVTLERMLKQVPSDVSVAATGTLVPHLSSREVVQMLPHAKEVEVILMDLRRGANYWPSTRKETLKQLAEMLRSKRYGVSDYDPACCVLLERGESKTRNAQVLRSLP